MTQQTEVLNVQCPHGYDECWQGCAYPGRCGRFRIAFAQHPTWRIETMKVPSQQTLYIRSMGKALRVLSICTDVAEANDEMERHDALAVIAEFNGLIFLADRYDSGTAING